MCASNEKERYNRFFLLLALLMAVFIFWASTFKGGGQSGLLSKVPGIDKLVHATMYALLSGLFIVAFSAKRLSLWSLAGITTGCAAYGLGLEYVQLHFFPSRAFEWQDALANAVGAFTAGIAGYYFLK